MTVAITYKGADDLTLEQVKTDGAIVAAHVGNTQQAIEAAAVAAGVDLAGYEASDLNMIEKLVSLLASLMGLVVAVGAAAITGLQVVFDGVADAGVTSSAIITGKKAVAVKVTANLPPAGDELRFEWSAPGGASRAGLYFDNTEISAQLAGNAINVLAWTHASGQVYAIWRDSATGAWGVVLPDGTDTGDLSAAHGSFAGDASLLLYATLGAPATMTVQNTGGPALPAGFTYQTFA